MRAKRAYLDGELCGIGADGLPSFSRTQAASDGQRGVPVVYFAFDCLHFDGRDMASIAKTHPYALAAGALAISALANRRWAKAAERNNPPTGQFLEVDGVRLHYSVRGSGTPLVLLWGASRLSETSGCGN